MTLSRNHKQLRISNLCPMDLNFLLFIENIYECYHGGKEVFPGRYLISNDQELLDAESFNEIFHTCWYEIVKEFEQQHYMDNPFKTLHFRDCYKSLFRRDSEFHTAERVWNSFSLWWWSDYGIKAYMERYTDLFMPELAEQIWKGLYEKNIEMDDGSSLYVMLLFKQPAMLAPMSSKKLFYSTINNFVYKKDEVVSEIVDLFV
ncbi:hypothetical protein [Paenibacillus agilis]|uniref:Group-specific protein n=1 Tax=Paenibacillus agilis TaxID=3020863 RepID=A0A559J2K5_9BACL|nr:hypothetical protein [Paenibacillus agilis]TVX94115.1 hypothetical protein FPZ44_14275 [Paenibacillus agilis]